MAQSIISFLKVHLTAFIYFLIASIVITYPLIFHMTDALPGVGDELLITWIMNWNIHALFTNPLQIFEANIFYPYHNTLAYSDIFFTSTLIALPFALLINQPAFLFNFTVLFSLITLGFSTYLLVFSITRNRYASIISGTLIAFSTFTMTRLPVVQLIGIAWVPLSILFFLQFLQSKKYRFLYVTVLFFLIQVYNSFLPGYFLLLSYVVMTVVFLLQKKVSLSVFLHKNVLISGIIAILFLLPIILPYLAVSRETAFTRDIRDAIHFGNRPEYSLYPSDKTRFQEVLLETFYRNDAGPFTYEGYIGFTFLLLFFFLLGYIISKKKKFFNAVTISFLVIAISAYILSLGPALQWGGKVLKIPFIIPLLYAVFYYLIPGFSGMRNSARWEFLALFGLSILIGIALADVWKKKKPSIQLLFTGVLCLVTIIEYPFPLPLESVPTKEKFPVIYKEIAKLPREKAIIELPLYSWRMAPFASVEFQREYYSTAHFRKMVNGYSGFSPIPWEQQAETLIESFPSTPTLTHLKRLGVSYLVVHKHEYVKHETLEFLDKKRNVPSWETIHTALSSSAEVKLLYHKDGVYLYELL